MKCKTPGQYEMATISSYIKCTTEKFSKEKIKNTPRKKYIK